MRNPKYLLNHFFDMAKAADVFVPVRCGLEGIVRAHGKLLLLIVKDELFDFLDHIFIRLLAALRGLLHHLTDVNCKSVDIAGKVVFGELRQFLQVDVFEAFEVLQVCDLFESLSSLLLPRRLDFLNVIGKPNFEKPLIDL